VAHAIVLATEQDRAAGRTYNVAEEPALSTETWVRTIAAAAGWPGPVITVPAGRLPRTIRPEHDLVYDTSRIRNELGFREVTPPEEALRATIAWERANPPAEFPADQFDYAAEDELLKELGGRG